MIYLSFTEYHRKGNYEGFKYSIFDLESVILVGPFQLLSKKKKKTKHFAQVHFAQVLGFSWVIIV